MKKSLVTRVATGSVILVLGILVLGEVAGLWHLGSLADSWWTLFFIVPGIVGMASGGFRFWNVFLVLLGVWLLAMSQGWLGGHPGPIFLGVLLVFFGIWVIVGAGKSKWFHGLGSSSHSVEDTSDNPEYTGIFANAVYKNLSRNFTGGKASAVFGSVVVDLHEALVLEYAAIEVAGVFGRVEIRVPDGVRLRMDVVPVFGSVSNLALSSDKPDSPVIEVKGASVFGTVRIL